jgi:hypothetical protein
VLPSCRLCWARRPGLSDRVGVAIEGESMGDSALSLLCLAALAIMVGAGPLVVVVVEAMVMIADAVAAEGDGATVW